MLQISPPPFCFGEVWEDLPALNNWDRKTWAYLFFLSGANLLFVAYRHALSLREKIGWRVASLFLFLSAKGRRSLSRHMVNQASGTERKMLLSFPPPLCASIFRLPLSKGEGEGGREESTKAVCLRLLTSGSKFEDSAFSPN